MIDVVPVMGAIPSLKSMRVNFVPMQMWTKFREMYPKRITSVSDKARDELVQGVSGEAVFLITAAIPGIHVPPQQNFLREWVPDSVELWLFSSNSARSWNAGASTSLYRFLIHTVDMDMVPAECGALR